MATINTLFAAFLAAQSTPPALRSDAQRALVAQPRAPFDNDTWDGYPAAREAATKTAHALDDARRLTGDLRPE